MSKITTAQRRMLAVSSNNTMSSSMIVDDLPHQQLPTEQVSNTNTKSKRVSFSEHSKLAVFEKFTCTHKLIYGIRIVIKSPSN